MSGYVDEPQGGAGREMTLAEWVNRLPPLHSARGELERMRSLLKDAVELFEMDDETNSPGTDAWAWLTSTRHFLRDQEKTDN